MVENKITAILPNALLVEKLRALQSRSDIEFPVFYRTAEEALETARECIECGAKVIISRGLSAMILRAHLDIPVVEVEYDFFQFAHAMRKALQSAGDVAVVGFIDAYRLAERAIEFVQGAGERVQVKILTSEEKIKDVVREFGKSGTRVFVGGNTVVAEALAQGYGSILVEPDEGLIEAALTRALYELRIHMEREEKYEMVQAIVNCASNGIFAVDSHGFISVANPLARKYLKLTGPDASTSITELLPQSKLLGAIAEGQAIVDDFVSIGDVELVMSSAPVVMDGEIRGAVATIQELGLIQDLDHKIRKKMLHKGHTAQKTFDDIVGDSLAMRECKKAAQNFAKVDSTVLILGKTGTGKEVFAQSIHNASARASKPFVAVNCAALPSSLLESELFGYTKGAFTGARNEGRAGIFELAHTGTIFLDEISEIPPEVQARLLRVIQEREVMRIGDDRVIPVDVRILAASNRDLLREVRELRFREDLYYRLDVLELVIPQLSERRADIPALVDYFVRLICAGASVPPVLISTEAVEILRSFPLHGNVRQLRNIIEKTLVMSNFATFDGPNLRRALPVAEGQFDASALGSPQRPRIEEHDLTISSMEREMIMEALSACRGNRLETARRLGISPTTLWRRMKAMGLATSGNGISK